MTSIIKLMGEIKSTGKVLIKKNYIQKNYRLQNSELQDLKKNLLFRLRCQITLLEIN